MPGPGSPNQPGDDRQHTDPTQELCSGADLRIVVEDTRVRKEVEPVVLGEVGIADGDVGERLTARIRHVDANWQKLFEEEKCAERGAENLALKGEIDRQGQWNG